jgi:hypothetical protein
MTAAKVFDLPISGIGCGEIKIESNGVFLRVSLTDGIVDAGQLFFDDVTAFRFRDEMHSRGFIAESYDTLFEIQESAWLKELIEIEPEQILGSVVGSRHFVVFLSSNGYLEVIAKTVELRPCKGGGHAAV